MEPATRQPLRRVLPNVLAWGEPCLIGMLHAFMAGRNPDEVPSGQHESRSTVILTVV